MLVFRMKLSFCKLLILFPAYLNPAFTFCQLIDRGKVDVKDVALEIGISPDALTANINVMLEICHVHFVENDYFGI